MALEWNQPLSKQVTSFAPPHLPQISQVKATADSYKIKEARLGPILGFLKNSPTFGQKEILCRKNKEKILQKYFKILAQKEF